MNGCTRHVLERCLTYMAHQPFDATSGGENSQDLREALSYLISEEDGKLWERYRIHSFEEWYNQRRINQ